jgi:ABC-type microcin C transport system permease subunit YejB
VALPAFLYALVGVLLSSGAAFAVCQRNGRVSHRNQQHLLAASITAALWAITAAWASYLLYSLGWLPGATQLQSAGQAWAAGAATLVGGSLSLLWSGRG